jgi:hypothetical protein
MNIKTLAGFDKVKIKHHNPLDENNNSIQDAYRATHVALVKEGKAYIGVARVAPGDQFNKTLGREIAIGRALQKWKVDAKISPVRSGRLSRFDHSLVRPYTTEEELETVLMTEVFDGKVELKEVKPDAEPIAASGCCGGSACGSR